MTAPKPTPGIAATNLEALKQRRAELHSLRAENKLLRAAVLEASRVVCETMHHHLSNGPCVMAAVAFGGPELARLLEATHGN